MEDGRNLCLEFLRWVDEDKKERKGKGESWKERLPPEENYSGLHVSKMRR